MKELDAIQQVFKALADPTRARIVGLLIGGEVCVCHIYETLRIPQSKASRHLAYLRRAGIVEADKRGLWVYYRIADRKDDASRALLAAARRCLADVETVRKDGLRLEKRTRPCQSP